MKAQEKRHKRKNNKPNIMHIIPPSCAINPWDNNEKPTKSPIIPKIIPHHKQSTAKPFAVCSGPKSLLDSKEGEIFLFIEAS